MVAVARHRHLTATEEWRALQVPEGWKAELIGGEIIVTPAPATGHAILATRLAAALDGGDVPDGFIVVTSAVEWEIAAGPLVLAGAPQPDVVVMELADVARLTAPPLLAAEVLSPSDRALLARSDLTRIEAKRRDYAEGGLADYLEVDRGDGDLIVRRYELTGGELRVVDRAGRGETIESTRPFAYTIEVDALLP
jgi:Uma2 family endonuclease